MWNKDISDYNVYEMNGYLCFTDKDHPLARGKGGYVYLHRHIASISEGRWINGNEDVHHIDENKHNNDPANLEVLSRSNHLSKHRKLVDRKCKQCGTSFRPSMDRVKFCSYDCSRKARRVVDWPSKVELIQMMKQSNYSEIGRKYGVSGNTVKKWVKRYGIYKNGDLV